jgi:hypothetical protein
VRHCTSPHTPLCTSLLPPSHGSQEQTNTPYSYLRKPQPQAETTSATINSHSNSSNQPQSEPPAQWAVTARTSTYYFPSAGLTYGHSHSCNHRYIQHSHHSRSHSRGNNRRRLACWLGTSCLTELLLKLAACSSLLEALGDLCCCQCFFVVLWI